MPATPPPSKSLLALFRVIEDFEAADSVANTGAGTRRDGESFEKSIARMWELLGADAKKAGAALDHVRTPRGKAYAKLTVDDRSLFLPSTVPDSECVVFEGEANWLETTFLVSDMVAAHPGTEHVVEHFAPHEGSFASDAYPGIYAGLSTKFDDNITLTEKGKLHEKILLEYKSAKSSGDSRIDGNAHERLSFQIMQYLEIATQFPTCSLVVMANSAFVRFRNKYHVNFQIQAERLSVFPWFHMRHHCTRNGYHLFTTSLMQWLFENTPRHAARAR